MLVHATFPDKPSFRSMSVECGLGLQAPPNAHLYNEHLATVKDGGDARTYIVPPAQSKSLMKRVHVLLGAMASGKTSFASTHLSSIPSLHVDAFLDSILTCKALQRENHGPSEDLNEQVQSHSLHSWLRWKPEGAQDLLNLLILNAINGNIHMSEFVLELTGKPTNVDLIRGLTNICRERNVETVLYYMHVDDPIALVKRYAARTKNTVQASNSRRVLEGHRLTEAAFPMVRGLFDRQLVINSSVIK